MTGQVIFSQLRRKFIDESQQTSPQAQQVIYYGLAIGHHLGVIDCLSAALTCPLQDYHDWIATLSEGEARRKMEGVARYGEIVIDNQHVAMLAGAFDVALARQSPQQLAWSRSLLEMLHSIHREQAIYLMVRRQND
ncbi:formate hydrogenlyase maturation protein HycH [Izhakiella australiensis]|uniref:Formate hydrogenlyase maturation protein HycH n=1 Tax=Izhakiella australiensis TaxID=1926881 RepID=A0A1S8YLZ1_9GAMM|nr:formate hydrogenlyase maturation HycH family protein [Izhakiella australiensis]OON40109.1 formate hydrogenlyase maturation protein HycH [Izhakiella australiensis]